MLPCIALACIALHLIALCGIPLPCIPCVCTAPPRVAAAGSVSPHITLHGAVSPCITLPGRCTPTLQPPASFSIPSPCMAAWCPWAGACWGLVASSPSSVGSATLPSLLLKLLIPPCLVTWCSDPPRHVGVPLLCVSHIHHPSHAQITPALLTHLPRDAEILRAPLHTPLIAILFNYWANYWKQQRRGPEPQALLQKKSFQLAGSARLCRLLPPAAPPAPAIPLPRRDAIWKLSAPASGRHYRAPRHRRH